MHISKITQLLRQYRLKGWLIYQYHGTSEVGLNPIADEVCHITELITRPWFCWIAQNATTPTWIYQSMELDKFSSLPGKKLVYTSRDTLVSQLQLLLPHTGRIAMEISPQANIPTLSRVDHGTYELVSHLTSANLVSSQDLIGSLLCTWGPAGLASHKRSVQALVDILDQTTSYIRRHLNRTTDYQVQQFIERLYTRHHLVTDYHPLVAIGTNTSNPHYFPSATSPKTITANQLILIDVWGKENRVNSIFSDITTMYYTGSRIPSQIATAWTALTQARNATLDHLKTHARKTLPTGSQLDHICRQAISKAGYGQYFIHRTGHNLATSLHAYGPNLDSYETKDDRRLLLDTGYSLEPGIYTPQFGLRSEINFYLTPTGKVEVTTPAPAEIQKLI